MNPAAESPPRTGLVVPVLSVLDADGSLIESDQRALVRYVIQDGRGADVVSAAGAVGERERLGVRVWQRVVRVVLEEVAKASATRVSVRRAIGTWVGITGSTRAQTLDNLAFALECGADGVVLAPHAIAAVEDPLEFIERDVAGVVEEMGSRAQRFSLYLDDERDLTASGNGPIRTRLVRALSRLDFVRGIAAVGRRRHLGRYARAAARDRAAGRFGVYAGEPQQIFDLHRSRHRILRAAAGSWTRRHLGDALPSGVMAASANAFPREWAHAWQACRAGDAEPIASCRELFETFRARTYEAGGRRTIACYKRALQVRGVISSAAVARGTPALRYPDVERFDRAFEQARACASKRLGAPFTSELQ